MDNFNLRKFLTEGKLHEAMFDVAATEKIAQQVADAFTAEDNELDLKYVVSPGTEAGHFDLDVEAGENTPGEDWKDKGGFGIDNYLGQYAGGSFLIKNGVVINAAMRSAPVANVTPEGEVEMISAEDSRAAIGMEEGEMLDEGMLDGIKDKIVAKVEKVKDKFSDEEIEKMKSAAERALGKSAEEFTMADFTIDNIKKVGKAISALNEEQIEEGLGEKIQAIGSGLGMAAMFVGGNLAMGSQAGGIEGFVAGAIAFVLSLIVGGIINSRNNEAQEVKEIKSNKMKKSELKEMIKAAMMAETSIGEAEKVEVEDDEDVEVAVSDEEEMDIEEPADEAPSEDKADAPAELSGDTKAVSDHLESALEAARALGDEKLVDQIGNTITFFTRAHIVKEDELQDEAEEMLQESHRMRRLAGLIK